jgi:hypothetical protein
MNGGKGAQRSSSSSISCSSSNSNSSSVRSSRRRRSSRSSSGGDNKVQFLNDILLNYDNSNDSKYTTDELNKKNPSPKKIARANVRIK